MTAEVEVIEAADSPDPSPRRRWRPRVNPVLARELRQRARGGRTAIILSVFLGLLIVTLALTNRGLSGGGGGNGFNEFGGFDPFQQLNSASVGRSMFEFVLFFLLLLVIFIVPGIASGAIAGERERQTLIPLQATLMGTASIMWGKVMASVVFLFLLVIAAVPMLAATYLLGGVNLDTVFAGIASVLAVGIALAVMTVGWSALLRRVQVATVVAYVFTFLLVGGTLILFAAAAAVDASRGTDPADPPLSILAPNPVMFVAEAVGETGTAFERPLSPFNPLRELNEYFDGLEIFPGGPGGQLVAFDPRTGREVSLDDLDRGDPLNWKWSVTWYAAASLLLFWLGWWRARVPAKVER